MAVRFEINGRQGTLDVVKLAREQLNGEVTGVEDGIVQVRGEEGDIYGFSIGKWATEHQATIVFMQGFNDPDTALDSPPLGMNHLDQSAYYNDGADINALKELYPDATTTSDGRTVVLDSDGLWKTMWSANVTAPLPPMTHDEEVDANLRNDPRLAMRVAGINFFCALAGIEVTAKSDGNYKMSDIVKTLKIIQRNAPIENRIQIGKVLEQTTGLNPWKFNNALLAPDEVDKWMKKALTLTGFEFRSLQFDFVTKMVRGLRAIALDEYARLMKPLLALPESDKLLINLKAVCGEFVTTMVQMDILRDISKTTGLSEWVNLNEGTALDDSVMPDMPEFIEHFVKMMRWILPIVKKPSLQMVSGKKGLKAIIALCIMVDGCIYSLSGVPDHSAKFKMFFALKRLQAQLETKLAFVYQPDPEKNRDGMTENPFMKAKGMYKAKRDTLYKLCQVPQEAWNNTLLASLQELPNIEIYYDSLPAKFAEVVKSFAAMDAAFDIQPWVDVGHAERTHDPFSQYNESFGAMPPEAGYLAKNSPRATMNISESLVMTSAYLHNMSDASLKELLRNPFLFKELMKAVMTASVNREIGTVEVLNKFGIGADKDQYSSPDASRIWEDPEVVQRDNEYQMQELMGQLAMEQSMQEGQSQDQGAQEAQMGEAARDGGETPPAQVGGQGPMGPPQRARPAGRSAA